ncbi:MAG: alpha/beta hydrolase, partial [Actinomycetota bacterium]
WEGENPYGTKGNELILSELISNFADGRDVYLVGHSAGGTLAAQYAVDYPEKVKGLILISPAILTTGGSPGWLTGLFYLPQFENLGPLLVSSIATSGMGLLNRSWFDPKLITDEVIAGYKAPLQIKDWERGFWEFNRAPREFDVRERLAELDLPVLLITGNSDTVVPTKDTEALAGQIKSSVLFVIPNSGHLAQEETPQETLKAIRVTWSILARG